MKSKGFTLIEVLAVIVILGIIATITIPKINEQLNDSKKNVSKASALNYTKIIEEFQLYKKANKENINLNGTYNIDRNGNIYNKDERVELEIKGEAPKNGILTFENNELISGCITINKYAVSFTNGEPSNIKKGKCIYDEIALIPELVTSGDGLYASNSENGRLIYRGANPNNWIWLDENGDKNQTSEELYRIISYETDGTIKVQRNTGINSEQEMPWDYGYDDLNDSRYNDNNTYCKQSEEEDYTGCNFWGNQSNTTETNPVNSENFYVHYYNSSEDENITTQIIGTVTDNSFINTYLNNTWINTLHNKSDIVEHNYYVGGLDYFLNITHGGKTNAQEIEEIQSLIWKGKIGLITILEAKEASTNNSCTNIWANYKFNPNNVNEEIPDELVEETPQVTYVHESGQWPCSINNWTYARINEWTMTANQFGYNHIWYIGQNGLFSSNSAYQKIPDIKPVFYLSSNIILTGEGTTDKPYKIIEY